MVYTAIPMVPHDQLPDVGALVDGAVNRTVSGAVPGRVMKKLGG